MHCASGLDDQLLGVELNAVGSPLLDLLPQGLEVRAELDFLAQAILRLRALTPRATQLRSIKCLWPCGACDIREGWGRS